jgi:leucyl-tRNA synthetase
MKTVNILSVRSRKNVQIQIQCSNPDAICNEYGADTLRLYEMFLEAKPWNTAGISGVLVS